jgi:crotonobetainyl-CoA:carnitine CoA-transferase CaiB-like acyl-CoA transferase
MSVTGAEDGEPTRAGIAIADLAAGMFAANAILAALFSRLRTGLGQRIDISLLDSQVALMSYVASNYLVSGEAPRRYGNGHPNIVPYQSFRARDGFFAFAAGNDGQWRKFCQAVDRPWLAEDARFATNGDRVRHRGDLVPLLNELFGTRPARDWLDLCQSIGIPAAPINAVDQVFRDPQVQARGLQQSARHPQSGEVPLVGSPLCIPTAPVTVRLAPPHLGEHTDEILSQRLGCTEEEIAAWRKEGVI